MKKLILKLAETFKKIGAGMKKRPVLWAVSCSGLVLILVAVLAILPKAIGGELYIDGERKIKEISETEPSPEDVIYEPAPAPLSGTPLSASERVRSASAVSSITPEVMAGKTVSLNSAFKATTNEDMPPEDLAKILIFEPNIDFNVSRDAEFSYTVTPKAPLPTNEMIKLAVCASDGEPERRWAFQTEDVFRITSVFPRDGAGLDDETYVSRSSGIEVSFSYEVSADDYKNYFEITPAVSGKFEKHRRTMVFVPNNELKAGTEYKVTVKAGLSCIADLTLQEDFSFSFKTYEYAPEKYFYAYGGLSETFIKGDTAVIDVRCSKDLVEKEVETVLYRYENSSKYKSALEDYIKSGDPDYKFAVDGLFEIFSSNEKPLCFDDVSGYRNVPCFIMLPDNLEEGYYIADMKVEEFHVQYLMQVSPISVYAGLIPENLAFFINDVNSGKSANGANVTYEFNGEKFSGVTNEEGILNLKLTSGKGGKGIVTIEYNGSVYIDYMDSRNPTERKPEEDYFSYIYTDRAEYRPTDTINVWGMIIPRKKSTPPPEDLSVVLGERYYRNYPEDSINYATNFISLNADGTFTSQISFEDYAEMRWLYVVLKSGENVMTTTSISISDYVKPTYVFEVFTPYYAWLPQTNPVKISATAHFFEGTPAKNIEFDLSGQRVKTNEDGYAEAEVTVTDWNTWEPRYVYHEFKTVGLDNEDQKQESGYYALCRDTMLETEFKDGALTLKTSFVDPTNFKPKEQTEQRDSYTSYNFSDYDYWDYYYYYDYYDDHYRNPANALRGAPADVEVTATLTRSWYTKSLSKSDYNFITKQTTYWYDYTDHTETVGTYTFKTVNGTGTFNIPANIPDSQYRIKYQYKDSLGQNVEQWEYIYNGNYYSWESNRDSDIHHYYLVANTTSFTDNMALGFKLYDNGEEVVNVPADGKIFLTVNNSEFLTATTVNAPTFTHIMNEDYIPNVCVSGAYFDGKHVFALRVGGYYYDPQDRKITLEVSLDKETYEPGEEVALTVTAKDKNNRPVPNASVSVSVVDEAAFAIRDQYVSTLAELYAYIYVPSPSAYFSYIEHSLKGYGEGEKGGGDPDYSKFRKDFEDTAAFLTGNTNANGSIKFNFKLPDNITSWRVTSQVIGENQDNKLSAGNSKTHIIATQPLFLNVTSLPYYMDGDDITASARVDGTASNGGNAPITANVSGEGVDITLTGVSNQPLNFGKLPKGEYKLRISTSFNGASDAIELSFEVIDSLLETPIIRDFNLSGDISKIAEINPKRYPVGMYFYDNQYAFYADVLRKLQSSYGARTEFKIANEYARLRLGHITEEEYIGSFADISSKSLIPILPYAEGDLNLTALICVAAPELVNKSAVTGAFYNALDNSYNSGYSRERVTYSYLGLAALSEPVLADIIYILDNAEELNPADRLRLIAALSVLGAEDEALDYYLDLTGEDKTRIEDGGKLGKSKVWVDLRVNPSSISAVEHTSLALITASILNLPEADGMARYLYEAKPTEQTVVLELMTYLEYYVPEIPEPAVFSYFKNGETVEVELARLKGRSVFFNKDELSSADISLISGDVGVIYAFIGSINDEVREEDLTVTKSYRSIKGGFEPGALVEVTLKVSGGGKWYYFDDVVPSCARYEPSRENEEGYISRSGQRLSGGFNKDNTVKYRMRIVSEGEFVLESAVARSSSGGWGTSERSTIITG